MSNGMKSSTNLNSEIPNPVFVGNQSNASTTPAKAPTTPSKASTTPSKAPTTNQDTSLDTVSQRKEKLNNTNIQELIAAGRKYLNEDMDKDLKDNLKNNNKLDLSSYAKYKFKTHLTKYLLIAVGILLGVGLIFLIIFTTPLKGALSNSSESSNNMAGSGNDIGASSKSSTGAISSNP